MNLHTTRRSKLGVLTFFLTMTILGLLLLGSFGGPTLHPRAPLRASVVLDDAGGIPVNADVLVHGVRVGVVASVHAAGARTRLELSLRRGDVPPLRRDASVRIAAKTPLGESFVDLDPGRAAGPARGSGARLRSRPAVEVDEALRALNPGARRELRGVLGESGRSLASPAAAARVRASIAGLDQTVGALDRLGTALSGQAGDISSTITSAQTIFAALAARDADIRQTVAAARTTLTATAGARRSVEDSIVALPPLEREATATLRAAQPLLRAADPVVRQVAGAAPDLSVALRALPATAGDLATVLDRAPALRSAATPALIALRRVGPVATSALARLGPALANLVPMLRYLGSRTDTIAAWFANTADLGANGDAKGRWARFFIQVDPATVSGAPLNAPPGNAYTRPHDAASNAPYRPGDFPRLLPYAPALGR